MYKPSTQTADPQTAGDLPSREIYPDIVQMLLHALEWAEGQERGLQIVGVIEGNTLRIPEPAVEAG